MIEFRERSNRKKSSRWTKKYPRTMINRLGGDRKAIKQANWYKNNYKENKWKWAFRPIEKFLKHNVGRPVDKVFSEFIKRCDSSTSSYNLRKVFYDHIKNKEEITWAGGFYVTNGILNYKKRTRKPECAYTPTVNWEQYNLDKMPNLASICKKAKSTRDKQFMGMFYISDSYTLKPVYLIERALYNEELYWLRFKPCRIRGAGDYIQAYNWDSQSKLNRVSYKIGYNFMESPANLYKHADFIFITKIV